ncbi:MAG TPA: zf-HC2 domain-containing protein, partial [Gemmatimonadales bacterium]|nr:zf-HC2 domain-containing protein [Gemmatimonadales bacterium]
MNPHAWFVEQRTAFVARTLEPDEQHVYQAHLDGCAECRDAVQQLERELAWLPMGLPPATVRPGLHRQLVA